MAVSSVSSSSSSTSYPVLVNGIMCYSAAEVTAAKSFQNLHAEKAAENSAGSAVSSSSPTSTSSASSTSAVSASSEAQKYPVTVNGQLCFSAADVAAARNFTSENKPRTSGTRGTIIDLYA